MTIAKVVVKTSLTDQPSDLAFWMSKTPQERLAALEEIRTEYHNWKYDAEPRLQRVYRVVQSPWKHNT